MALVVEGGVVDGTDDRLLVDDAVAAVGGGGTPAAHFCQRKSQLAAARLELLLQVEHL